MSLRIAVVLLAVLLPGCPGEVTEIPASDGTGGNTSNSGSSGRATSGAPAPNLASSSDGQASGGRPASGDGGAIQVVTSTDGATSTGSGGDGSGGIGSGGDGSGGYASGGDAGAWFGDGGDAGAPDDTGGTGGTTVGTGTTGAPHGAVCWFERLGYGTRCYESAYGSPDTSTYDLQECAELCLQDEACTSIVDHTVYDGYPCRTYSEGCTPDPDGVWYEEDGGFEYVKVCGDAVPEQAVTFETPGVDVTPGDNCHYMALDDGLACENAVSWQAAEQTGDTLEECLAACDALPECTAVQDEWGGGPTSFECVLHLSSCDQEVDGAFSKRFFKKVCD